MKRAIIPVYTLFLAMTLAVFPGSVVSAQNLNPESNEEGSQILPPEAEGTQEGDDLERLKRRDAQSLDSLFEDLKRQTNPAAAKRISRMIWREWTESSSDTINLLMDRVAKVAKESKNGIALDLLDDVITLAPDYAEGWNRRATIHFAMKEFGRSLSDIEQVLRLEPRHYGALSGLANILQILGRDREALAAWYKVLEIYPANEQAQSAVIKLEEKLAGSRA